MHVEIMRRSPGEPHVIWQGQMDLIPRVGDFLGVPGLDNIGIVHSVTWLVGDRVRILMEA